MRIQGEVRTNPIYIFVRLASPSHRGDAVHLAISLIMSWAMDTILNGTAGVEKKVRTLLFLEDPGFWSISTEKSMMRLPS